MTTGVRGDISNVVQSSSYGPLKSERVACGRKNSRGTGKEYIIILGVK